MITVKLDDQGETRWDSHCEVQEYSVALLDMQGREEYYGVGRWMGFAWQE
jgi:hypothetical protein